MGSRDGDALVGDATGGDAATGGAGRVEAPGPGVTAATDELASGPTPCAPPASDHTIAAPAPTPTIPDTSASHQPVRAMNDGGAATAIRGRGPASTGRRTPGATGGISDRRGGRGCSGLAVAGATTGAALGGTGARVSASPGGRVPPSGGVRRAGAATAGPSPEPLAHGAGAFGSGGDQPGSTSSDTPPPSPHGLVIVARHAPPSRAHRRPAIRPSGNAHLVVALARIYQNGTAGGSRANSADVDGPGIHPFRRHGVTRRR
jgi:hypothetical protein